VLASDRPHDITSAYGILLQRRRMLRIVKAQFKLIGSPLMEQLTPLLQQNGQT
jgi:hypothetical protein